MISTEGTFSARLDRDAFLITPHQLDRHTVDLDDVVLVRGGAAEAGKIPSRAARLHQAIYQRHAEIGAVVNAYTVNATAFSVTAATLDARTIPESFLLLGDVAQGAVRPAVQRSHGTGRRGFPGAAGGALGQRRGAGMRAQRVGCLRSAGSAGIHGRNVDQRALGRHAHADVGCGDRRIDRGIFAEEIE